jgi:hypothetical protein
MASFLLVLFVAHGRQLPYCERPINGVTVIQDNERYVCDATTGQWLSEGL